MNCPHSGDGWCLQCVKDLNEQNYKLLAEREKAKSLLREVMSWHSDKNSRDSRRPYSIVTTPAWRRCLWCEEAQLLLDDGRKTTVTGLRTKVTTPCFKCGTQFDSDGDRHYVGEQPCCSDCYYDALGDDAIANTSLLAALEECAHALSFQASGSSGHDAFLRASAAIAKAKAKAKGE